MDRQQYDLGCDVYVAYDRIEQVECIGDAVATYLRKASEYSPEIASLALADWLSTCDHWADALFQLVEFFKSVRPKECEIMLEALSATTSLTVQPYLVEDMLEVNTKKHDSTPPD